MKYPAENRKRFHGEVGLAGITAALAVLTLTWPDWIEEIFGVDPDKGSGTLEWAIVLSLALVSIVSGILARAEWRRLRSA
jgi:hypothetical protein